jgi:predicted Zn-dependent peptidase
MKHTVSECHLSGGASGLIIDVPGSSVVSLQVRFNSGYQFANRARYEVPHVMEHILANVTAKHSAPNEFMIEAQKNGAYVNASTSVDVNGYIYEFAEFELDRIVGLLEEQLAEPFFDQDVLIAELGNVKEELLRITTQHSTVCSIRLAEKSFPQLWLDYEKRISQLDSITLDEVRDHYTRTHTSANARFVVAGNFPDGGEKLRKQLDQVFGRLPKGERLVRLRDIGLGLPKPIITKRSIGQMYYRVVMYFGELTEPERRALTLLRFVLVGGMASRVLGEARRRGLAYTVGAVGHAEPGNSSFGFLGYVSLDNAMALFELTAREYNNVRRGDLTEIELDAAKDLLVGSMTRSTQTAGDLLGWYMEPYDESGEIRDFESSLDLLRQVRIDEIVGVAEKASAASRPGLSFLGKVNAEIAKEYESALKGIWL